MRLITLAIHTYQRALEVKSLLEAEGIDVTLQNVNLEQPEISSGVRLRINESDLPLALRIVENPEIFSSAHSAHALRTLLPHNILVPVDFSDHSYTAARVAIQLAAIHHLEITFLHSYIDPHLPGNLQLSASLNYDITAQEAAEQLISAANGRMSKFTGRIREEMKTGQLPLVRFSHVVVEGVPEDAIINFSKQRPPYLVVMGTRTASAKEKDLIGSVTAEVLNECRFSVLAIPYGLPSGDKFAPENILFFGNLDQEDILAMDTLYRYFSHTKARVTIVDIPARHRFTDKTAGNAAMALSTYCEKKFEHYTFESIPVQPRNALNELERLSADRHFDLIVVPNRRRNVLTRMFNPGIAHRMLFHSDIPMLVIPV